MKIHYNIEVRGHVQGVWFRKYTKEKAVFLNINGFVQNELKGTVYIEAEGTEDALSEFVDWLTRGSPLAKVDDLVYNIGEVQDFTGFEIRRNTI